MRFLHSVTPEPNDKWSDVGIELKYKVLFGGNIFKEGKLR